MKPSALLLMLLISGVVRAGAAEARLAVTPSMLSGPLVFFATPAGVEFAEPVPYGFENNLADRGWIWPNANTGLLVVDFGAPTAVTKFRVYCTYNGGERGANWAIERSEDNIAWVHVANFPYRQGTGVGVDDSGNPVDGYGGWYQAVFNSEGKAVRYWRIRQTEILVSHAPRSGQMEFYGITGPSPKPTLKSISPSGNTVRKNAVIAVELEDGAVTQVAPASVQLTLNGQAVTPTINKPAGSKVTTIAYDPKGTLPESTNKVHLVFGDTATPPVVQTADFSFVVINDAAAGLVINIDFNGVRNDPGPDVPGPTFEGQGAGGGGGVWNGISADSRTQVGADDNDNLTVSAKNLLNSIGEVTAANFTISPVGGDVFGTATADPKSSLSLFSDQIFVGFGAQITLTSDFTISGLGTVPYADLYFYTSIGGIKLGGGQELAPSASVLFKSSNTRFFRQVPVSNGEIKGALTGDPGRLAGISIVRAAPHPFVKSAAPTGGEARRSAVIKVELQDNVAQVASGSIQLLFNGQPVQPTVAKPAGSGVTTVTYDPPGPIAEGKNSFRIVFSDTASPPLNQSFDYSFLVVSDAKLLVTPAMLSGPLTFFASPAGLTFKNPIPYGIANNVNDNGWIWPSDNSGLLHVDFGTPTAVAQFRVYSTYPGGARGAVWAVEASNDDANWVPIKDFTYETKQGGGLNEDGTPRSDFGGWYGTTFNETGAASYRYWQIRQTSVTIAHAPRCGQVEFYAVLPEPSVTSFGPTGAKVARDATIVVELHDNKTAVNPSSIQFLLNGQPVVPVVNKPAGSRATTVTYDPPTNLPGGVNTVRVTFNNNASPPVSQALEYTFTVSEARLEVAPEQLAGPLKFFASPAGLKFGSPIPYGITNNTADKGWIWPQDNSGSLEVDFGIPTVVKGFRVYSTYPGDGRGANWAIEYSNGDSTWSLAADFAFVTTKGGGLNDDGAKRTDFGGWYEAVFNSDEAIGARYWRVRQTKTLVGHAPRAGQVEFYGSTRPPFAVTAKSLSGPLTFFASPAGLKHSNPIPYGITNNVADNGWIWPQNNSGLLAVDFGQPEAVNIFRVYSTYPGGGRGALWAIERSSDNVNWTLATEFPFETKQGAGLNDDGSRRTDFGGWYGITFNAENAASRYWRVRQIKATVNHAPRAGEVEFYAVAPAAVPLSLVISRDAGKLIISWLSTATLQSAIDVTGPWADVAGATSPRTITPAEARQFYRLRQ